MEIKVRDVGTKEEKSVQEKEQEILNIDEKEKLQQEETKLEEGDEQEGVQIKDEDVLSYISKKYQKEVSSFDDLFKETVVEKELPEDVSTYLKFKEETGRGFDDFVKYQKDYDSVDDDSL